MPFTVPQSGRSNLFIWARDWTGITEGANVVPDWWYFQYYGTNAFPNGDGSLTLTDTNLDTTGNPLLHDYTNGLDPNVVQFTLSAASPYVNTHYATVQAKVTAGIPFYYAVVADGTALASTNWFPYVSSNIPVTFLPESGWHYLAVGLRGLPTNATETWQITTVNLQTNPPVITVTHPSSSVTSQPLLQLQGLVSASLASFTYNLSNAAGILSHQPVLQTGAYPDTNTWMFTTNSFQAYDVPLTNGVNTLTLFATDLAGNTSSTNFSITLSDAGDTNAPVITITWPPTNPPVAATGFSCMPTTRQAYQAPILPAWFPSPPLFPTQLTIRT